MVQWVKHWCTNMIRQRSSEIPAILQYDGKQRQEDTQKLECTQEKTREPVSNTVEGKSGQLGLTSNLRMYPVVRVPPRRRTSAHT